MSPIATLIFLHGQDANVITPAGGGAYNPGAATDFRPGAPGVTAIRGVFQRASTVGLDSSFSGTFTVEATSIPDYIVPGKSALSFILGTKIIMEIDPRHWAGAIDGYVLKLAS